MRGRPSLRTRLLAALVLVAAGVVALAGAATFLIVQATAEDAALDDLREKADEVERQAGGVRAFVTRTTQDSSASPPIDDGRQLVTYLEAMRRLLRLADARVVFLAPDGRVLSGAQLGEQAPRLFAAPGPDVFALPESLAAEDLAPDDLLAGRVVTGATGSTVFLARPVRGLARKPAALPVLVLTQEVETRVVGRAGPAFLIAAGVALLVSAAVSFWLARRLTRPLQAVQATARRLAAGDLAARVEVDPGAEDELASLASTLNTMAAQLEQARGAQRAFLLSVSHDLRTPLTSIRGYAEALADGTLDATDPDERARAATIIAGEARRLERLVRDLLDLSRLDARQFSLHPRPCDAATVAREAVEAFAPAAADLGIALRVPDTPAPVAADLDPDRLGQIVANLVENALKYAAGRVEVDVRPAGGGVAISVTDDGPGIPADELPRVFERLYTVRSVPGRSVGTGIGLAIVRELAHAMAGSAHAEAVDGAGSRFVVWLPAGGAEDAARRA